MGEHIQHGIQWGRRPHYLNAAACPVFFLHQPSLLTARLQGPKQGETGHHGQKVRAARVHLLHCRDAGQSMQS